MEIVSPPSTRGSTAADAAAPRPARPAVGRHSEKLAAKTVALYAGDWMRFRAFCVTIGAAALPASAETVIGFLQVPGLGHAAARRHLAAINQHHRACGLASPGETPAVRAALKQVRKSAPRRPRAAPPRPAALHAMAGRCRLDLAGLRDRAVLLLLAAGLSRGTVVGLHAEGLRWTEDGLLLGGPALRVPRADRHDRCPVRAIEDWLRAAGIRYGPVFRKVTRWGTVEPTALGADAIRRILLRHAAP